jgi:short-subunit dehydrogenase
MQGFLEALRIENLHNGLHVLIACPGFTASNIRNTALAANGSSQGESPRDEGKMMTAEEVAVYVLDAIEKRRNAIVLTRQGKLTVWLNKFFPGLVDKLVFNHMAKEPDSPFAKN